MARYRLSNPAEEDLVAILAVSLERWGEDRRRRYAALIVAAMRAIAADPTAPTTRARSEVSAGLHSVHLRPVRDDQGVKDPVHVIYYRVRASVIEIVRVLHERMEPTERIAPRARRS